MSEHLIENAYSAPRNMPVGDTWKRSARQRFGGGSMPPDGHSHQAAYIGRDGDKNVDARLIILENKVDSLATDVGGLKTDVGALKVSVATLAERSIHLATSKELGEVKDKMLAGMSLRLSILGAVAALILFADKIKAAFSL